MHIVTKASHVLMNEGPAGFLRRGGGFARQTLKTLAQRSRLSPLLKHVLLEGLWQLKTGHIKVTNPQNYSTAWGEARRAFYDQWRHIPCSPPEVRRLQSLHNKYQGQRVFIMGNGPSLNQTPLEKLANEYTFGVNRVYLLFDRISWRPSFYTTVDWRVAPDNAAEINALRGMTFFFPQRFWGLLRTGEDVYWYSNIGCHFAHDISRGVCGAGSVTGTAIQIAYYLGFDPIYLIGVDASYTIPSTVKQSGEDVFGTGVRLFLESTRDDDPNHFDPRYFGKGSKWHDPNVPRMLEGYRHCRAAIEGQGRHIYNATVGGKLELFERVDFNSLF